MQQLKWDDPAAAVLQFGKLASPARQFTSLDERRMLAGYNTSAYQLAKATYGVDDEHTLRRTTVVGRGPSGIKGNPRESYEGYIFSYDGVGLYSVLQCSYVMPPNLDGYTRYPAIDKARTRYRYQRKGEPLLSLQNRYFLSTGFPTGQTPRESLLDRLVNETPPTITLTEVLLDTLVYRGQQRWTIQTPTGQQEIAQKPLSSIELFEAFKPLNLQTPVDLKLIGANYEQVPIMVMQSLLRGAPFS